jgi:nuclear protein localization family protein 4
LHKPTMVGDDSDYSQPILTAQLLRIRSPSGTARLNVTPETTGEDFAQMMMAQIPAAESAAIDPSSLKLSNQPGEKGELVAFDALRGRKVGDMGFT